MKENIQHRNFDPERVRQNFADVPVYYDYRAKAIESRAIKRVLDLAEIEEQESVLEAGVGTGMLLERIFRKSKWSTKCKDKNKIK